MVEIIAPQQGRPYVTVVASDATNPAAVPHDLIIDLYKTHGALLLRGFQVDLPAFRDFAQTYCSSSVFNESPDRRQLDEANNIQSVNGGVEAFPLHPELSREPWKPDVCFFSCLAPPSAQGETTICDGVEIVRHLPPEIREGFAARRLHYLQMATPELCDFWLGTPAPTDAQLASPPPQCPYFFFRVGGRVVRGFSRPALHTPMFTAAPAFGNFLLFARYLLGNTAFPVFENRESVPDAWMETVKAVSDRLSVPIQWRKGDLLMLDNTRFMHGRNAITDPEDRLIASYFGYLKFALPNPEEPADPPWRSGQFRPPVKRPPAVNAAGSRVG